MIKIYECIYAPSLCNVRTSSWIAYVYVQHNNSRSRNSSSKSNAILMYKCGDKHHTIIRTSVHERCAVLCCLRKIFLNISLCVLMITHNST